VADRNPARAHVTCQARESKAAADVSPEIDDHAVTPALFQILNSVVQCVRKCQPKGAWEVRDLKQTDVLSNHRVDWALRLDNRRALLCTFPHGDCYYNLFPGARFWLSDK
jgi:hypothetical protein